MRREGPNPNPGHPPRNASKIGKMGYGDIMATGDTIHQKSRNGGSAEAWETACTCGAMDAVIGSRSKVDAAWLAHVKRTADTLEVTAAPYRPPAERSAIHVRCESCDWQGRRSGYRSSKAKFKEPCPRCGAGVYTPRVVIERRRKDGSVAARLLAAISWDDA